MVDIPERVEKTLKVLAEAARRVEPGFNEKKKIDAVAAKVLTLVETRLEGMKPRPKPVFGGSYAKGTWLSGEADIDIFVKFSASIRKTDLERVSTPIGLDALADYRPYLRYSEHPYVEAIVDKVKVNVVGCFDVKPGEWISSADRSPYHTEMILSRFNDTLRGETRLLKRFLKSNSIYGSEIRIQGFSGYVCEVLVLRFGNFIEVVREAQSLGKKAVIALSEDHYQYASLHRSPLIILDPVDPRRNLGAAISRKNSSRFIFASHCFLVRPSLRYFRPGRISSRVLYQKAFQNQLVMVKFEHSERSADVIWGQLRRSLVRLERQITIRGFNVLRSGVASNDKRKSALLFLLERTELSPVLVKIGPEVNMIEGAKLFLKKNFEESKMTWIGSDGRLYVTNLRRQRDVASLLKQLLAAGNISSSGVAPGLARDVAKTLKIVKGSKVLIESNRNIWLKEALVDVIGTDPVVCGPTSRTSR